MENKLRVWGILKRIDGNCSSIPVQLTGERYTFGRSEECDFKFTDNKYISKKHCYFEKDKTECNKAWFEDESTNGSLLNLNKKILKKKIQITHNDIIYIVYRKNEPDKSIIYQFEYPCEKINENISNDKLNLCSTNLEDIPTTSKHVLDDENDKESKKMKNEMRKPIEVKIDEFDGELTENITCSICSQIMHDSISLQPCLHTYCAGCYSEWMEKSNECPVCRSKVERISKNHLINNIIEAYLKKNPNKKRSDDEIIQLDQKNKINHDMLYPKKDFNNDENSDDNEGIYSENEEEEENNYIYHNPYLITNNFNYQAPILNNFNPPFKYTCRQCPQNKLNNQVNLYLAPNYTCNWNQNHLLCQCCLEAFPDRSYEISRNPIIPKQNCSMCFKSFCNLYWGCNKIDCKKCLVKFCDLNLDDEWLKNLINDNQFESELFRQWLIKNKITMQDVFDDCIVKIKNGIYKLNILDINESLERVVCRKCGFLLFQELAYQFRKDIPNKDVFYQHRPNCQWGKECRTQKHNDDHSK